MAHAPHSFRAINVFIQHTRYEIVFVLRWELVAMCSGEQKITGVLWFREQLPHNMTRVGRDGPKESLVCIAGHVVLALECSLVFVCVCVYNAYTGLLSKPRVQKPDNQNRALLKTAPI